MEDLIIGPMWPARNWSSDAGAGSIHDDSTASNLGFRGGTVAGSIHMNQFPPVLMRVFGFRWFEQGNLSLNFKNATVDEEEVQVFAEPLADGENQVKVWMERNDGLLVAIGTAAMGDHSQSELQTIDQHAIPLSCVSCATCTPGNHSVSTRNTSPPSASSTSLTDT